MREKESEFEKDRQIDIHNLHTEFQMQADYYGKWGTRKAVAIKERFLKEERLKVMRSDAKRRIDEKKAELDLKVRSHWDNPDMWEGGEEPDFDKKPTEAAIANWIMLHPALRIIQDEAAEDIKNAVVELAEVIENAEYLEVAVLAMSHRKAGIEGEINLWLNEYYSDPKIPKTLREEVQKETQEKIRRSLKMKGE